MLAGADEGSPQHTGADASGCAAGGQHDGAMRGSTLGLHLPATADAQAQCLAASPQKCYTVAVERKGGMYMSMLKN